jgi:hypothetical protein
MAHDFVRLYAELGLQPGCSLEEFKLAYRRRVAELHPDRLGPDAISVDTHQRLSNLIASYRASLRFHRQYGRLPGCNHSRAPYAGTRQKRLMQMASMPSSDPTSDGQALPLLRAVVIAIVLIAGLLLLQMAWDRQESGGGQGFSGAPSGYVPCLAGADPGLSAAASDRLAEPRTGRTQADAANTPTGPSTAKTPGCVDL